MKKRMGVLLILLLVMIISVGAISAADTNDTLLGEDSDTNIETASSAVEQDDNVTSSASESDGVIEEISVDDSRNEIHKMDVSSASNDVLSASNDDLLKHSDNNFQYGGEWYYDLEDAWAKAEGNGGGTIKVWTGYYKYTDDDDDFEYKVNTAVSITLEPYGNGPVVFDGGESGWFLRVTNNNVKVTINDITFKNMKARDGGAIEVEDGAQLTLNRCIFENNYASSDGVSYGLGGAIVVDEGSLIANNCSFLNNKADRYGGAICIEDKGSVTLNNCYFEGNKKGSDVANDFDDYDEDEEDAISWSFDNCLFKSDGSIEIEVDAPDKEVTITPDVSDDVNYAVLYKDDSEYARLPCNDGDTVTFGNTIDTLLEPGTYTVYMMKNYEKRYIYSGATFTIIEPNFILNDKDVFETLSAAINAISNGGNGVITVVDGTYSGSSNLNVQINNKIVTIRPKDSDDEPVVFSGNSQSNFLIIGSGSKLTLEDITITGKFSDSALKFTANSEGELSDCKFKNIQNAQNQPGNPIKAQNSNLVLDGNTFESNSKIILENTVANIDDCTFTSNMGVDGAAIYADSSSDLTVTNSEFNLNQATNRGGAIYATNLKLESNEFIGNSAILGGAVFITSQSDSLINITSCVFDTNIATSYRNIYFESPTRKFNLEYNEYDLDLQMVIKDSSYGSDYILDGVFDWGSNLNNAYTFLTGYVDEENVFGDLLTVENNKFKINLGILSGGSHEFVMAGMYTQGDSIDHFHGEVYYNDLYGNEFYLNNVAHAKIGIEKANITLNLVVANVLIPETPVLNVYANFDLNYTIFIQNKYYQIEVVNGKGSMQLTDLDLGNYTVVGMRDGDENFNLAMNFTTFSIDKTYSNFLVLGTNVEYDTLKEAVANSNDGDVIYIKKGTYADTGIVISNKTLDIIALEGAIFDAQGKDANFIIVEQSAEVYISGITFRGLHNRNTNYGAIVNHGDLTIDSCNFTDNRITKTSFAGNGGAAIFNDGDSLDIDNCNFISNVAPLKVSTAAVTSVGYADVSIMSSKFINNSAREGGAIHFKNISQFESAVTSCDFENNIAVKGSAIYVGNNSRYITVALSHFKNNDIKNNLGENAQLEGGVIYVNANTTEVVLDIDLSNFENNSNSNVDGGVICLDGISKAYIDGSVFNNNKGRVGSAILIKNPYGKKTALFLDDSNFINNNATIGAIATSPGVTTFVDECVFTNNTGENRHIYSNGFTVVHDSILDVKNVKLDALTVQYGENSIITGMVDIGTNVYAAANLTVAGENIIADINNNAFTYKTGILNHGKYYAVLNSIGDANNNTYLMDSITQIFRVNRVGFDLNVSVDNVTYGQSIKVVESIPPEAKGTVLYQFNGNYYTKEEIEALKLDAGKYTLVAVYDHEDFLFTSSIVKFEVYKANPTISVADVEVEYNERIIVNIQTDAPSIYTIEIEDYKNHVFVNGSRSVEIEKTFVPGTYTIKVTSQERVNYVSDYTEAILNVKKNAPAFSLNVSDKVSYPNDALIVVSAPENAVGNIKYTVLDSNKNVVYTITQSCKDNLTVQGLNAGIYEINGVFEGDDLYDSTDNIQLAFMVYPSDVSMTLQFNNITYGQDLVITPEFSKQNVEGSITYVIGDKVATLPANETLVLSGLDEGNYNIAAFYMGCDNYNSCKFLATVNVGKGTSNNIQGQSLMGSSSIRPTSIASKAYAEDLLIAIDPDIIAEEEEEEEGRFIYQSDEDDDDYSYFDTLEDAIDEAVFWGQGIITVRGGTYYVSGCDVEGEVELTIRAYGDEEVIFDCGGENYFLYLTYETEIEWTETTPPIPYEEQTEGPTVTLENITVINGYNDDGGAIEMDAGMLTLTNCNFRNNKADNGGVIYVGSVNAEEGDANVIAVNTTFTNNYASDEGGVIYIGGGLTQDTSTAFYFCTFLDNYQGEDEEYTMNYFGGDVDDIVRQYCIFNAFGEIYTFKIDKINQTVYVNGHSNDAFDSVVLLYDDETPLYTIYNNGSLDFNVTFEDVMGGNYTIGVMNDHDFNTYIFDVKFEMKVPNFIISEEEVYENLTDAIDAVAENGIIYANMNYYDEENMEIEIRKSFTLKNFRGRDVIFDGSSLKWFFTVANGYTVEIDNIYFTDGAIKNHATIENYGTLILNNCTFESFETGTIIYNSGLLNILNSVFTINFVDNAIVWNENKLVIDGTEFSSNIINKSSVVYSNGDAEIISSNFTENFNGGNAGAVYNKNSLSIKYTVFNENEGIDGGAVYNEGTLEVINSTFEDNTANGYGGAIFNGNEATVYNSTFTGGYSEVDGGAIYNNNMLTVDNSTLVGNSANGIGGAIYNNKTLVLTKSFFGINYADEFANIYNAGDIQFSENTFDFYDVILIVPDGQYGLSTTITGTLDPQFNMDLHVVLPGFVNRKDAAVTISEGVFEYVTDILPKGIYNVVLNEVLYDEFGNIYYGEAIFDRLVINKANVYINLTVDDVILPGTPVLKISVSKNGVIRILFNNKFSEIDVPNGQVTVTLDTVPEGSYSVLAVREGDENYNDAVNTTSFTVSEYEGKFIVNSTGNQFETLREALADSSDDDVIYVREGNYSGADNLGLTISGKKLTIISLGDVVFDANSTDLSFLTVDKTSDVTISDVVITGFNAKDKIAVINNTGKLTLDECIFINNTIGEGDCHAIIFNFGNLTIVESEFCDNIVNANIIYSESELVINESTFENNTLNDLHDVILLTNVDSAKIISTEFDGNILAHCIIAALDCGNIIISSSFSNNTQGSGVIYADNTFNLVVDTSIFAENTLNYVIDSNNNQTVILDSVFTDNTVENAVLSRDKNLSVIGSIFTGNTLSGYGALNIASDMNASVEGCAFSDNKADNYRNIYSVCTVNITDSVFDALNVDFRVYDIDYGQSETIEGSIDIGTNLNFTANLDINSKTYSVNVTDNNFTLNAGILNGGDYTAVLNPKDDKSNTFVFDKITKVFTVNRIDPGLSVSIGDITQGEKLKVNLTISKNATAKVVYELDGNLYSKAQLENLTLRHGNYVVVAMYRGDKNHLPATEMVSVEVRKIAPNITVSDVSVNYTEEIKVNVSVDVADYYTVFIGNESVTLFVEDSAIFTFQSTDLKPDTYEILVYVFEEDDYAEAYAHATLTVNKAVGLFNLSNDIINYGQTAVIYVSVPVNAYGNITYNVYDDDNQLVYTVKQSCNEVLAVPELDAGIYTVTGTFEGDSYYSDESIINSGSIFVNSKGIDLNISVSNITYGENATVNVESNVDGEYLVYVGNKQFAVTVINGTGNVTVSDLGAGIYTANATIMDDNYVAVNETAFEVAPKSASVSVSVEDIVYGADAIVTVNGEIDGEYIVVINNKTYTVNVADGKGNVSISGLAAGENIQASVSIANGNYSAYNNTTFNVAPKQVTVIISVGNTTYGEDTVVIVQAEVDGNYIVSIRGINYTVSVNGGDGVKFIHSLAAGENIQASVSIANANYSAENTTTFNINPKEIPVSISIGNIVYGEDTVVIVQSEIAGDYIVTIRDVNYTVTVSGGNGVMFISNMSVGNQIVATVQRNDNYSAFGETRFNINQKPGNVEVTVEDITWNESATVNVVAEIDGMYTLSINNVEYQIEVTDGKATQIISDLAAGKYDVEIAIVDGNYSASNKTAFNVAPKPISIDVSVEDITYEDKAVIVVESLVDGEYLVYVDNEQFTVTVVNGTGNVSVSALTVGSHVANVTIVNGNYSGFNSTSFAVEIKQINISVVAENITYEDAAVVTVESVVDGEYLVYVDDVAYAVVVNDGIGSITVDGLTVGSHVANVTVVDGNYSGFNSTSFAVEIKQIDVSVSVEDIIFGESAVVTVESVVDGEYLVYVDDVAYTVVVNEGVGSVAVDGLTVGSHAANVTVVDGNYSAFNKTSFKAVLKFISVIISVEDIIYEEKAEVVVESEIDGEYLVCIGNEKYTVTVIDGTGNIFVPNLAAGSHIANVTVVDGNYSGVNSTSFAVEAKEIDVSVSVEDITYGDSAIAIVESDVDGEYIVEICGQNYTVKVAGGKGNVSVSGLFVGEDISASVSINDNYTAYNTTTFNVVPKEIPIIISVANITYGEDAVVIVQSDVDGDYIVTIRDVNYTVSVNGGNGVEFIHNLYAGDDISASVSIVNGNYTAFNSTSFDVAVKEIDVSVYVDDITYGEEAVVIVEADVDGEYLVYVDDNPYVVNVADGIGNVTVYDLTAGSYDVDVFVVDGNYSGLDSTSFDVAVKEVDVSVSVGDITYGEEAVVIVEADVDGEYLVYVDGTPYVVNVADGIGNVTVDDLTAGYHVVNVTAIDDNYDAVNSTSFAVAVKEIEVSIHVDDIDYGESAVVVVEADVDGEYLVYVNGTPYVVDVEDGMGSVNVDGLSVGSHIANVTVIDGNYSAANSTTFEVVMVDVDVDIDFDNETTGIHPITLTLPSDAGGNVSVYINGTLTQVVKVINGSAVVVPDLNIGYNNVTIVYSGDGNYGSVNKSVVINRKSTIMAYDMIRGYNSGMDYTANLFDGNGLPLVNANVTIKVDTNTYIVQTDSNGVLKFNNRLAAGDYAIVIVNPETEEYKLTNLKIMPRITDNRDVTIFFADGTNYRVRAVGDDGSYVGAGEVVSINVGGKTYSVKTDANGYANLKLSLKVKKHTITVTYKGFTTKNKVTVKSVVKPVKKTVKVKKTAKKLRIKVKLKGKQVLKKKRVYMKFKGKTYKAKTNKKGIATFKVPKKVIKKLKKGKKYKAVFTYKAKANGKTIKNTAKSYVKVKK